MKIREMWADLFHADGRTDMTKLTVAFRSFAVAPESGSDKSYRTNQIILFIFNKVFFTENNTVYETK